MNSPWGVRKRTTAPGIRSSLAVVSTMVCSAAWSIGLSADGRCLVLSRTPVSARHESDGRDFSLVFILDGIIPQFSLRPDVLSPNC